MWLARLMIRNPTTMGPSFMPGALSARMTIGFPF
jgi:hypothetical protein